MIKKLSLIFLFSLFSTSVFAQNYGLIDKGSIYSKFGLGMPVVYGSSAADGMGLWGVSFIEVNVPGIANPAHWGSTVYATATGGFTFKGLYSSDNTGTAKRFDLNINRFQLVLPVYKGKLGVSIGFMPYTDTGFQILENGTEINGQDTLSYFTTHTGHGGVNKLQGGIGWRISKNVSIGYAASLVFASIDNSYTIFSQNITKPDRIRALCRSTQSICYTLQTSGIGWGNRVGAYFNFPKLFGEKDQLSLGASFTFPVDINAERELESPYAKRGPNGELVNDIDVEKGSIQLPMGVLAGMTYMPNPKLAFSVEGLYQEWSAYENTLQSLTQNNLVNRFKIGAGLRYFPFLTGSNKFLSNFKYRFGVSYDKGHLKLNDHRIETLMFSLGLGYITPLRDLANSSIDLSFHFGLRGTQADNLVQESVWKIKLSVNLAELFFFRPKIR